MIPIYADNCGCVKGQPLANGKLPQYFASKQLKAALKAHILARNAYELAHGAHLQGVELNGKLVEPLQLFAVDYCAIHVDGRHMIAVRD